jgi:hypothetical protein
MTQLTPIRERPLATAHIVPAADPHPAADNVRRVIGAGLLATVVMVALLAASQLINYGAFHLRIGVLDTDRHSSVFGVASLLAQLAAAAAICWRGFRVDRLRGPWLVLGGLVAGLVLLRIVTTFNAKTVAGPLACVFLLMCWLTWRDSIGPRSVVWAALTLMLTSLVLHQVGLDADVLNYSNQSWAYQLTAVAKHGCELAGWMLMATGVIAGIADRPLRALVPGGLAAPVDGFRRALTQGLARRTRA